MAVEKGNIFLSDTAETVPFASRPGIGSASYPSRDRGSHASYVRGKLQEAFEADKEQKSAAAFRHKEGVYLEFSGSPEHHLAIKSLENRRQGIRLLNVREEKTGEEPYRMTATVYIPAGRESYFLNKVEQYATESTSKGKPRNNDLIRSIDDIKLAVLQSFWIGNRDDIPSSAPVWCEVWLYDADGTEDSTSLSKAEEGFLNICDELGIRYSEGRISFPERTVRLINTDRECLDKLLVSCSNIAEIRRAQQPSSFFVNLTSCEQKEWVDDLLNRTRFENTDVAVCILDTGLAFSHPLIKMAVDEDHVHSLEDSWGTRDTCGHGTAMAGIALYGDLREALEGASNVLVPQRLESVKILPPRGKNPYELYGFLTQQAVYLSEIGNPEAARVFCLAVTSSEYNTPDGAPTSWSGAIDSVTSAADEEGAKRLFFISAGNVKLEELCKSPYPESSLSHGVESPGQSWNALTVGAYAKDIFIADPDHKDFSPLADSGELSPYSSTSKKWRSSWPIKPEILFDGGNVAARDSDYTNCDDLSLLTTNHTFLLNYFTTISGTSPATALAAWMGSRLMAEYPKAWPETIRALIVHSANWTPKMKEQFCAEDTKTKGRRDLLRACGYGVPDLQRAIQCMSNRVNLVIEDELQPFEKKKMKDMHFHKLPWPREVLESLGETPVTLKVTLSYFIEPGPGEVGWRNKYRYPSCGLRFDLINVNESPEDFRKRINVKARGDDIKDKGESSSGSERWFLGSGNRDVGSIHSDFCVQNAVELCDCNVIAVYPVIGWWRERPHLGKCDSKVRYSLIVSLETPEVSVDLYTSIVTQISGAIVLKTQR